MNIEGHRLRVFKKYQYLLVLVTAPNNIISDQNLEVLYNELISKMEKSGIWEGQPFSDENLAKRFKPELELFVQEKSYLVKEDKVAIAQSRVDETKAIATLNVVKLAATSKNIEEKLLPSAIDIVLEGKQDAEHATNLQTEVKKRGKQLYCYMISVCMVLATIVAVLVGLALS